MPTRLVQSKFHASGTAALQVTGAALVQFPVVELVEIAILQAGPIERFMDPRNPSEPWTTAVYWFRPVLARRESSSLSLEIDYGVTFHLRANQPYTLRLRDQLSSAALEERFTGPVSMRRPSAPPEGWVPPPDPSGPLGVPPGPKPAVDPVETDLSEDVQPDIAGPQETVDATDGGIDSDSLIVDTPPRDHKFAVLMLIVVVLMSSAVWWFLNSGNRGKENLAVDASDTEVSLASIRKLIASGPDVAQVRTKADELAKAGKLLDGQFLLYKYASEKGDSGAALVMGGFYDPDLWEKSKSPMPAPNPLEAARWYKQGAEGGEPEAAYRYATLLKKGRTDEVNAEEQAIIWLRKAAMQGHIKAKQELGQ